MAMPKAVPTTTIHQGASAGMDNASSQAVIRALWSLRNGLSGRWRSLSIIASVASAVIEASVIDTRIAGPKNQTYMAMPGISASRTRSMIWLTLLGVVMKGDDHMMVLVPVIVLAARRRRPHPRPFRGSWRGAPRFR